VPQLIEKLVTPGHIPVLVGHKVQAESRRHGGHRLTPFERAEIAQYRHYGKDYNKGENNKRLHFSIPSI